MPLPALIGVAAKSGIAKSAGGRLASWFGSKLARRGAATAVAGGAAVSGGLIRRAGRATAGAVGTGVAFAAGERLVRGRGGMEGRKYRRMNVANTRALTRATRRLKGFADLSAKVMSQLARTLPAKTRRTVRRHTSGGKC